MITIQISELAQKNGVSLRSLRYYEEKKLLQPKRLENGYRQYSEMNVEQIRLIQLYLKMGLKTNEIAELFHYKVNEESKDECIRNGIEKGEMKLTEIREQIAILRKEEAQLMDVITELNFIRSQQKQYENLSQ